MRDAAIRTVVELGKMAIPLGIIAMLTYPSLIGTALAGAPSKDQQKCVAEMNKRGLSVSKAQAKSNENCLKSAIAGKTSKLGSSSQAQTATACLSNDVREKVARSEQKLVGGEASRCLSAAEQLPQFAYTNSATVGAAAKAEAIGMTADLFGSDLDLVTTAFSYPDDIAKDCQRAALKATDKLLLTLWKTANKEKSKALKGGKTAPVETASQMQLAVLDAIVVDAKGKLQKASGKAGARISDGCAGTAATLASLFPGKCSTSVTTADLAGCVNVAARCRFCQVFSAVDGLANGCDQFDDALTNGSCSGSAAVARQIVDPSDLVTGPLAHGRIGDYLLANDVARFVIQDAAQRDLYSVGAFGGNIIDAELIGHPGLDNFIEIQPAVNVETVINAQTIEIVNDGSNGAAAIIRTCGPDDILDFVNPSTVVQDAGVPFPGIADDRDANVEGCTSYILEPGSAAVEMVTTIFNLGAIKERLLVGDYVNAGGELDLWASGPAGIGEQLTGDLGVLSYIGFGEATGVDYAHVTLPDPDSAFISSFFSTSGVAYVMHSHSLIAALLGTPASFQISGGQSKSFIRYFGVGDGSGANAIALENRIKKVVSGSVAGCVTVGGAPAPKARVTLGPISGGAITAITANWTTDASGCFQGEVPEGTYGMAAWREGALFEGSGSSPLIHTVTVSSSVPLVENFSLPATGRISVTVMDEASAPIPARVSVVGFDPSPEMVFVTGVLGPETTGLFRDQNDTVPFGITGVAYADASGTVSFDVEPGDYQVFVSRGTEYSLFETPVIVTAGSTVNVGAQIAHVVDTSGFISSDYHVHGINSADSRVTHTKRVIQFAGEGVDNIIMTDHHVHTDLTPTIAALGYASFVNSTVGEEVTTWDTGHYNAYPLAVDPTLPSGGSSDWAKAAPPGKDFKSLGAYIANPAEVESIILGGSTALPETLVQINHIDSHFVPMEIDTSLVPPQSSMTATELRRFRMDPTSGNLFHHFPALELWNGDSRGNQSRFLDQRIGIWFNLLNQGLLTTAVADTDTHKFQNLNTAGARTWTASSSDAPSAVSDAEISAAILSGRAVGGQGPYVQARLVANENPAVVADLTLLGSTLIAVSDAALGVDLEISVQAPLWAEFDRIEIYANAATVASPTSSAPELFSAVPTVVLNAGVDFTINQIDVFPSVTNGKRLETSVTVPFTNIAEDTWFVVVVKGSDGVSQPMFPVFADDLSSVTNATLTDLLDGNLGESGVTALGFTNPLYVDADGVAGFQAPLAP